MFNVKKSYWNILYTFKCLAIIIQISSIANADILTINPDNNPCQEIIAQCCDMKKQIDILRASASLPYFSRPICIGRKKYLDGGCTDSIPVDIFRKSGYKYNVVVLTRDKNYCKSPEMNLMAKFIYRKYPKFKKTLLNRHLMYNNTVKRILELEKKGEIFVIRPQNPLNIGRLEKDPNILQAIYDIGFNDALKALYDMKKWIYEKKSL